MLRCADNSLYSGITIDLERRLDEHNHSKLGAKYTKARRPVTLVYKEQTGSKSTASKRECELKKLSKQQKELLINEA